jgi:hypothetical protein
MSVCAEMKARMEVAIDLVFRAEFERHRDFLGWMALPTAQSEEAAVVVRQHSPGAASAR